jgi:hypothetical protein
MKHFIILPTLFIYLLSNFVAENSIDSDASSLVYSIRKGDKVIGDIHVERATKNDITEYIFESNAKVNLLYSMEVYDKMNVVFKNNNMIQAKLYRTMNGKIKVNNVASWNGNSYSLSNVDGKNGFIKHLIPITTASLYFSEPSNVTSVFSEKFQMMIPIKCIGNKKYMMDLPNGNKVTYSYNNGICNLVEANTDWASLRFVLKTNNVIKK